MAVHKIIIASGILAIIALILIATSSLGLIITISYMLLTNNNPANWFLLTLIIINVLFILAQKKSFLSLTIGSIQTIFYVLILFIQPSNARITAIILLIILLALLLTKDKLPEQPKTQKSNSKIIDVKPK